ncbi:winged helix-turn-helix transcriptional regulator [Chitinophaga solisilvae]|uniref:Helix-turn-helix transcriptional regulator n=1 Tax=Chitinophaga solisilvae TaxID=1233460 RepID=A0A433WFL7_9BACT|nr:helix-turn-helix domain-containing protein [Chitinophaga solisilvae]NSL86750.1 helix-turn-helix transcriptional regulator [Chitinophaga solisilvae]
MQTTELKSGKIARPKSCEEAAKENGHRDCLGVIMPVRDALDVINGKWKLPIIIAISNGHQRFRDIERSIPKITSKVLSKELKDLETHKLIRRQVYDSQPVTVEYTLTPYAATLNPVIDALFTWGKQHRKTILGK